MEVRQVKTEQATSGLRGVWERDPRIRFILRLVALAMAVTESRMLDQRRNGAGIVRARHIAMYLLHTVLQLNYREVGEVFARNRRTVARACATVERSRDMPQEDAVISRLEAILELVFVQVGVCADGGHAMRDSDSGYGGVE